VRKKAYVVHSLSVRFVTGSVTRDRYGKWYVSIAGSFGKGLPVGFTKNLGDIVEDDPTYGYCKRVILDEKELEGFLTGPSINLSVGVIYDGAFNIPLADSRYRSLEAGASLPTVGVSGGYTWTFDEFKRDTGIDLRGIISRLEEEGEV